MALLALPCFWLLDKKPTPIFGFCLVLRVWMKIFANIVICIDTPYCTPCHTKTFHDFTSTFPYLSPEPLETYRAPQYSWKLLKTTRSLEERIIYVLIVQLDLAFLHTHFLFPSLLFICFFLCFFYPGLFPNRQAMVVAKLFIGREVYLYNSVEGYRSNPVLAVKRSLFVEIRLLRSMFYETPWKILALGS